tara:strand:- start:504 stop:836 length:333 start_codon:yes stop_codon:yes gene_type:complete
MKSILLSLFTVLFLTGAISQSQLVPITIAKVSSEIINTDTIQYTFISNYYIDDYKAPLLRGRILDRYSEVIDIEIDSQTQLIIFKTLTIRSSILLEKIVKHFKYISYEVY